MGGARIVNGGPAARQVRVTASAHCRCKPTAAGPAGGCNKRMSHGKRTRKGLRFWMVDIWRVVVAPQTACMAQR